MSVVPFPGLHMAKAIQPGDRARLCSGGPEMICVKCEEGQQGWEAECIWLSTDEVIQRRTYPVVCLVVTHKAGQEWPLPIAEKVEV